MIRISHRTQSLAIQYDERIVALFPHAQQLMFEGERLIIVPHGIDETRLLRNFDMPVPSPITEHYDFYSADGKRPFREQVITCELMTMNQHGYVLNDMGTGKTKAAIWSFDFLKSIGKAKRMLVVAPLSTLQFTWQREIMNTIPNLRVSIVTGSAERRLRKLNEDVDIYIINHDGVGVVIKELVKRFDINVVCLDEVSAYRNRNRRSKIAMALARGRDYVWGMTGSPTPRAPTDAYGLAQVVTPETAPRSFVGFRMETMTQVNQFKWVPRKDAAEKVAAILQPAVRFQLDDIMELPPLYEREITVPMGLRQKKAYQVLKANAAVMLKEGTVTAANGGVLYTKMLQTAIGWVYGDGKKTIQLDNIDRINTLLEIIEDTIDSTNDSRKAIVFSPFISSTQGISAVLQREHIPFATVTGDTPASERSKIFTAFQGRGGPVVLNAHPECMSHGLTLTAADTIVWFGPVTKLESYEQANARIRRVGQTRKQQVIKLVSSDAERLAYRRLAQRANLQDNILDLLAELTTGDEA